MNDYRFTNIDQEPTDEMLAQLMREVAEEAKERWDKARTAYFKQLNKMVQAISKYSALDYMAKFVSY